MITMTQIVYPKKGTQCDRVLQKLLEAKGGWVSKRVFQQDMYLSQSGARIYELEHEYHWLIEHGGNDEFGFTLLRIIPEGITQKELL